MLSKAGFSNIFCSRGLLLQVSLFGGYHFPPVTGVMVVIGWLVVQHSRRERSCRFLQLLVPPPLCAIRPVAGVALHSHASEPQDRYHLPQSEVPSMVHMKSTNLKGATTPISVAANWQLPPPAILKAMLHDETTSSVQRRIKSAMKQYGGNGRPAYCLPFLASSSLPEPCSKGNTSLVWAPPGPAGVILLLLFLKVPVCFLHSPRQGARETYLFLGGGVHTTAGGLTVLPSLYDVTVFLGHKKSPSTPLHQWESSGGKMAI